MKYFHLRYELIVSNTCSTLHFAHFVSSRRRRRRRRRRARRKLLVRNSRVGGFGIDSRRHGGIVEVVSKVTEVNSTQLPENDIIVRLLLGHSGEETHLVAGDGQRDREGGRGRRRGKFRPKEVA